MTAFLGLFGKTVGSLSALERRAAYLYAPTLHFSLDGAFALCHAGEALPEDFSFPSPHLSVGCATVYEKGDVTLRNLVGLYRRYGKRLYGHIPSALAFVLYDGKRGVALFGGTQGEKCYLEETSSGVWFSSVPHLLRSPCAVDLAILKRKK